MKNLKEQLSKQKGAIEVSMSPMKPMLSLSETDLPEIKNWKIGKTYKIEAEIRQKGMHEDSNGKVRGEFEIVSVEVDQSDD